MTAEGSGGREIHDVVGVGYGPAAMAVAAVLEDDYELDPPGHARISAAFLERQSSAAWQPNLLLPGTDIQHHFLRDLATPRNPRSRFTFPNYLKETGRLFPFTLMGNYVTREEWSQYLLWAAGLLDQDVRYGAEVMEVAPARTAGAVDLAAVTYRDSATGEIGRLFGRNVLVSSGHQPYVPAVFTEALGERVLHASEYLPAIAKFSPAAPLRFAVIGAGQNAGEIFVHLAQTFPNAQVYLLARNSGIRMYELGHFSNEAYFPDETEYFYALDSQRRQRVLGEQHATNYSAVDPDLSTIMYRLVYADRFFGPRRLHVLKRTEVTQVRMSPESVSLCLREVYLDTPGELDVDVVFVCTGYLEPRPPAFLASFRDFMVTDGSGDPEVTKAHRVVTQPRCQVGLYLNGITEWRHGINSATSFSTLALKAERIARDLKHRGDWPNGSEQVRQPPAAQSGLQDPYASLKPARGEVRAHDRRPDQDQALG
ncbi:MAG TPA: SidA/IucD/PvdA family monooxygenase [Streptosporangiaceae bacterium]|nr:SidA/IucD/PvdA family monooxygenase [Streptosporangiaceae bacterium]